MKGAFVLIQSKESVSKDVWQSSQPELLQPTTVRSDRGTDPDFNSQGVIEGAIEGESMRVVEATAGTTSIQPMSSFTAGRWSGNAQLFWRQASPPAGLTLEFDVNETGDYEIGAVLTTARDYAMVDLQLDGTPLGTTLDLYNYPDVRTTGLIKFGPRTLKQGTHRLMLQTVGSNPSAVPAHMVGLDCLVLQKQ